MTKLDCYIKWCRKFALTAVNIDIAIYLAWIFYQQKLRYMDYTGSNFASRNRAHSSCHAFYLTKSYTCENILHQRKNPSKYLMASQSNVHNLNAPKASVRLSTNPLTLTRRQASIPDLTNMNSEEGLNLFQGPLIPAAFTNGYHWARGLSIVLCDSTRQLLWCHHICTVHSLYVYKYNVAPRQARPTCCCNVWCQRPASPHVGERRDTGLVRLRSKEPLVLMQNSQFLDWPDFLKTLSLYRVVLCKLILFVFVKKMSQNKQGSSNLRCWWGVRRLELNYVRLLKSFMLLTKLSQYMTQTT